MRDCAYVVTHRNRPPWQGPESKLCDRFPDIFVLQLLAYLSLRSDMLLQQREIHQSPTPTWYVDGQTMNLCQTANLELLDRRIHQSPSCQTRPQRPIRRLVGQARTPQLWRARSRGQRYSQRFFHRAIHPHEAKPSYPALPHFHSCWLWRRCCRSSILLGYAQCAADVREWLGGRIRRQRRSISRD